MEINLREGQTNLHTNCQMQKTNQLSQCTHTDQERMDVCYEALSYQISVAEQVFSKTVSEWIRSFQFQEGLVKLTAKGNQCRASQVVLVVKNPPANAGDIRHEGSIPETGRPLWGGGNGIPLQYSCQENPMDRGAWWAIIHGVAELNTTEHLSKKKKKKTVQIKFLYLTSLWERRKS